MTITRSFITRALSHPYWFCRDCCILKGVLTVQIKHTDLSGTCMHLVVDIILCLFSNCGIQLKVGCTYWHMTIWEENGL